MKDYFFHKSIKMKILYSMLTISVCMILVYMIIVISYSHKNMLNSSIHSCLQDITSAQNAMDNLLSIVEDFSVILATDETIQRTLSESGIEQEVSSDVILLRTKINDIIGTFPRINAVLITDVQGNIYDSGVTVLSSERVYDYENGWKPTHEAPYYISTIGKYEQPNVVSYTRPVFNYRNGVRIGSISMFINEEYIKTIYSSADMEEQMFFLLSSKGYIISSNDSDFLYANAPFSMKKVTEDSGFLTGKLSYYIYKNYPRLSCYFVTEVSKDSIESIINRMQLFMITIGISLICATAIASVLISRHLTKDISRLSKATMQVKNGDWSVRIVNNNQDEIGELTQNFNAMLQEIKDTTERLVNEQKAKRKYQLELLNQQINPHFLYNTLDNICALADLGLSNELTELVSNLSVFYRGVLSRGSLIISMEKELDIAVSYLKIMRTRYYGTFTFNLEIESEILQMSIPRLTLQPVLENAIYHGLEAHEPGGMIHIRGKIVGKGIIQLEVEDNGCGMAPEVLERLLKKESEEGKDSFALRNVHDRIQMYYGREYGISAESAVNMGTKIIIRIPGRLLREV